MDDAHTHERVWVIDPVDGTNSFIDGSPDFATMVALVESNEVTASWIWQPIHGRMFTAVRGQGSFENGERIAAPATRYRPGVMARRPAHADDADRAAGSGDGGFDAAKLTHTQCPRPGWCTR